MILIVWHKFSLGFKINTSLYDRTVKLHRRLSQYFDIDIKMQKFHVVVICGNNRIALLYSTLGTWTKTQRHIRGIEKLDQLVGIGPDNNFICSELFFVASSGQTRLTKVELGALGGLLIGYNLPTKPLHTMKIKPNPSFKCLVEQETDIHNIFAFVHCRYICQLDVKIQGHLIKLQLKKGK